MRYRLSTLLIVLAIGPPAIAFAVLNQEMAKWIALGTVIWLAHLAFFFALAYALDELQRQKVKK